MENQDNNEVLEQEQEVATAATINREFKFNFRKDNLGNKRATVTANLPVPTIAGLTSIIAAGGKQLDLLLDTMADVVYSNARSQVDDEITFTEKGWNLDLLTWEAIANMPKAERKGGGISKEVWESFGVDYIEVMSTATNKTAEQISNGVKLLLAKLQPVKTNKKVLTYMQDLLNIWFSNTSNAEDFADCYDFLSNKIESLLQADDSSLLDNL